MDDVNAAPAGPALRCIASIDDAGDYLFLCGSAVTFGHKLAGDADIGLLGDVEPLHGTLRFVESFHGGRAWHVQGKGLSRRTLFDGDVVDLGAAASWTTVIADPGSGSVLLELGRHADASGPRRVILFAPGASGEIRVGAVRGAHVPVSGLDHPVGVHWNGRRDLVFRCDGGARRASAAPDGQTDCAVELPVTTRVDLAFGAAPGRRPPFGIALLSS